MLIKVLRFIISIMLIPVSVAFTYSFYEGMSSIEIVSESGSFFILGALSFAILHLLLFKLDFLYVLGHECMHAVAAIFSGGKILNMKVKKKEGSVRTTKTNAVILLTPYLIPGYTVLIALLYFILSFFIDVASYSALFIFLTGFSLMFHLSYTAQSIREKQSDLIKTGYLFSIFSIYIINLAIVFAIVSLLFKELSFLDFLSGAYESSKEVYFSFWRQLFL